MSSRRNKKAISSISQSQSSGNIQIISTPFKHQMDKLFQDLVYFFKKQPKSSDGTELISLSPEKNNDSIGSDISTATSLDGLLPDYVMNVQEIDDYGASDQSSASTQSSPASTSFINGFINKIDDIAVTKLGRPSCEPRAFAVSSLVPEATVSTPVDLSPISSNAQDHDQSETSTAAVELSEDCKSTKKTRSDVSTKAGNPTFCKRMLSRFKKLFNADHDKKCDLPKDQPLTKKIVPVQVDPEKRCKSAWRVQADMKLFQQAWINKGNCCFPPNLRTAHEVTHLVGQGAFGFVFVGKTRLDEAMVCIKVMHKSWVSGWASDPTYGAIPFEAYFMRELKHTNAIKFLDIFDTYDFVYLVQNCFGTEWHAGNPALNRMLNPGLRYHNKTDQAIFETRATPYSRDLYECLSVHEELPIPTIRYIFGQVVNVVSAMHDRGFVHGDIKEGNILVDNQYNIRIIDFGVATPINKDGWLRVVQGTSYYMAPEIHKKKYKGPEAEAWALGVLLFGMAFDSYPFETKFQARWMEPEFPKGADRDLVDLIKGLLRKKPNKRLRLDEVKGHPFVDSYFWNLRHNSST